MKIESELEQRNGYGCSFVVGAMQVEYGLPYRCVIYDVPFVIQHEKYSHHYASSYYYLDIVFFKSSSMSHCFQKKSCSAKYNAISWL